ncbi:MAG: glycine--tRNA ligase [Deltaproteobacteria bacterium]|nr:glycine--tRNA ligase [Deltaproteobacteria bacterium]
MSTKTDTSENAVLMQAIVSLCKRRGFVFQSSEIYGGLKSAYDYGPLGAELKRNIMSEWWRTMVHEREDVVGLDASIIMHPKVWEASGHLAGFSDPLVDCRNCKERFRADKAPKMDAGTTVEYIEGGKKGGKKLSGEVDSRGYICPQCGSSDLSDERQFNLMFRTQLGAVDTLGQIAKVIEKYKDATGEELRKQIEALVRETAAYLRPETAQAMFVQFLNVQQTMSMKVPFGIAQMGRSFRNEITVEHFIFRSIEFEQMEMEYFVEPGTQADWLEYWRVQRLNWWKRYANDKNKFRTRAHEGNELAHYADACYDIEYEYPWGWGELEGVASRTDYDLKKHQEFSGAKLSYFDQQKTDPVTGKNGWRYVPYVIEPAAGATRAVLVYLLDAYQVEPVPGGKGEDSTRVVLRLHPRLAPIKAAVLPLVKKDGLPEIARDLVSRFFKAGINAKYDEQHAIGKRYRRHDEAGTPYCITIDGDTKTEASVTIRDRDTMKQERIPLDSVLEIVQKRLVEA